MTDEQFIRKCNGTFNPYDALEIVVENETFLGYDPYYGDIRKAIINMCASIVKDKPE